MQAQLVEHGMGLDLHRLGARIVILVDAMAKAHQAEAVVLVLGRFTYSGMRSTVPISSSIFSAASLAPPCAGPHRQAMPAAMQAKGLAPDEPASRTVEVEAFCSWSACRMKMVSSALASTGLALYSSAGTEKHMRRKFSV